MGELASGADRDLSVIRFCSGDWPEAERRDRLRDLFGRTITRLDFEPSPQCPLDIEARFRTLPGLGFASIATSATRVRRTPVHLASDDLILSVNLAGGRRHAQRGREAVVREGEAVLTAGAETSRTEISKSRYVTFRLPRKPISALVSGLDDCIGRPIRGDTHALRLLLLYARALEGADLVADPAMPRVAVAHIYDLVALALGATQDAAEVAMLRGAAAAQLRAAKADIIDNLGSPGLSICTVAARQRLPLRYMQRLFEAEGITFTAFVLGERLTRAHRLLGDPRFAGRPINAIAFEAGFSHLSHFNRSFRARFGQSPSDVCAQALPDC